MNKIRSLFVYISLFIVIIIAIFTSCQNQIEPVNDKKDSKKNKYVSYTYYYDSKSIALFDQDGDKQTVDAFNSWKIICVTGDGASGFLRVQRPENGNDTVSEGIGYGMILAVYFNDKTTFDALWNYAKSYLNSNGLMAWHINASGVIIDSTAATDADEDMALALIFADKKWSGYQFDAKNLLNAILQYETETDGLLKPGDSWGLTYPINPSYISPAWYKVFKEYTGDTRWDKVIDKNYEVLLTSQNKTTGLVPDWCNIDGSSFPGKSYNYSYDAGRTPWRIAIDYLWFKDARALQFINKASNFFESIGAANLVSGYDLNGSALVGYLNTTFAGPIACLATASDSSIKYKDQIYSRFTNVDSSNYYNSSLKALCMLVVSGNFPSLTKENFPVFDTAIPAYVTEETALHKIYEANDIPIIEPVDDVLKRPDPSTGWNSDFDKSYDSGNGSTDGELTWVVYLTENTTTYSIVLNNLNESDNPSYYNRLYSIRVLAVTAEGRAEYVYDNTGKDSLIYGRIFIPFIKPVKAVKLRIHLTSSRNRCHVKILSVNKKNYKPWLLTSYCLPQWNDKYGRTIYFYTPLSMDPEGDINPDNTFNYTWSQISGPSGTFDNIHTSAPLFTAPLNSTDRRGTYVLRLFFSNGQIESTKDFTVIFDSQWNN